MYINFGKTNLYPTSRKRIPNIDINLQNHIYKEHVYFFKSKFTLTLKRGNLQQHKNTNRGEEKRWKNNRLSREIEIDMQ